MPTRVSLMTFVAISVAVLMGGLPGAATADAPGQVEPSDTPELTVLDHGRAPRHELRYEMPVGSSQTLELRTYTRLSQRSGDRIRSGGTPNVTFTIVADVADVTPAGDLQIDYRYDDVEVIDSGSGNTAATRAAVEQIVGLTGSVTISDTGAPITSSQQIPEGVDASVRTLLEQIGAQTSQLAAPIPEAPIGIGARWRVVQTPELGAIHLRQSAVFTLEKASGAKVELASKVTQRAPRQEFTPPGSDAATLLLSSRGTGTGETTLVLDGKPLPIDGESTFRVEQRLREGASTIRQIVTTSVFLNH